MSDEAFGDLKEALEGALAFERGERRDLNRTKLHKALTDYAVQHAGTDADIDPNLEAVATDHLLQQHSEQ